MTNYKLHGLSLRSELAFPELPGCEESEDVHLRVDEVDLGSRPPVDFANWFESTPDETLMVWDGFARVRIRAGSEIVVDPAPGVDDAMLRSTLLGQVFSVLLLQRGLYPLHASSVVVRGRTIAFAGTSGAGKSSLAAALVAKGHAFVADDVVAVTVGNGTTSVSTSIPRLKLARDALGWLGEPHDNLPRVEDKHLRTVENGSLRPPPPLGCIYSICDGTELGFETLSARDAFLEVSRNCHRPDVMLRVIGPAALMERSAAIASAVRVVRLRRPRSLERLDELVARIEDHVGP